MPPCASGTREELGQEQQPALLVFVSMMEIWVLASVCKLWVPSKRSGCLDFNPVGQFLCATTTSRLEDFYIY